jgi:hypothetical protein
VERFRANCVLATASAVWIGTAEAHLMRLVNGEPERVESFDRMEGRDDWFTPWGGPPDTRSLAAGPTGVLYANVHVGGVARSTDQGRTWHPTMDIEVDCHQVLAHPEDASVVLAATGVGLGISTDGGTTWTFEDAGLHATYQRAVAVSGDRALVSTSRSERGQQSAVYRFTLGHRARFVKCEQGLPKWFVDNIDTGCLVARGQFAALGTPDGSVFMSSNLGETWSLAREGLPKIRCLAV